MARGAGKKKMGAVSSAACGHCDRKLYRTGDSGRFCPLLAQLWSEVWTDTAV